VLLEKGVVLTIVSRNVAHAYALKDMLQKTYNKNRIKVAKGLSHSDTFFAVVNTAAVDLESKQSEISIHSHTYKSFEYAYDVSYRETAFLKKAADFGARTKNGFDMLFYQAIRALEIWQGKDTGLDVSVIKSVYDEVSAQYSGAY
jgi:shikimate dehydrogenase